MYHKNKFIFSYVVFSDLQGQVRRRLPDEDVLLLQEPGKSWCGGGPRVDRHVEDRSWWWVVIDVVVMIPLVITDDAISNGNR